MMEYNILDEFTWCDISIQKDIDNKCFLILVCETEERKNLIYNILSRCPVRLELFIDPDTKIYSFNLVFRYNAEKEVEFLYDTGLTYYGYESLRWLNSGTVKFITTGTKTESKGKDEYSYYKPLLNLECLYNPN